VYIGFFGTTALLHAGMRRHESHDYVWNLGGILHFLRTVWKTTYDYFEWNVTSYLFHANKSHDSNLISSYDYDVNSNPKSQFIAGRLLPITSYISSLCLGSKDLLS
jgi:hypothetical protein